MYRVWFYAVEVLQRIPMPKGGILHLISLPLPAAPQLANTEMKPTVYSSLLSWKT